MKKTISEPNNPRQFTLNFSTPEMMEYRNDHENSVYSNIPNRTLSLSATQHHYLDNDHNNTVILSPTSVNNMAVTRQLKLVNLDSEQQIDGSINNCTSIELDEAPVPMGVESFEQMLRQNLPEELDFKNGDDFSHGTCSNDNDTRSRFGRFKAKFSIKRMTSPIRRASSSRNLEETHLATTQSCDDHTLNTTLNSSSQYQNSLAKTLMRTKTQDMLPSQNSQKIRRAMSRTVTCPGIGSLQDNQNLVSYISPPLGDFRHTAHLGHHGESFGDLSFLNSTKIEYTDKNAGLRIEAAKVFELENSKLMEDDNSAVDYVLPSTVADSLITDIQESINKNKQLESGNPHESSYNNLLATFLEQVVAAPPVNDDDFNYNLNQKLKSYPEASTRTASGMSDSGLHNSLQDSALESTSLSNDSASNTSNSGVTGSRNSHNSRKMVAMIDIERDISQIGQDYVDSCLKKNGLSGGSSKNGSESSCRSSRSNSIKNRKNYHDIEAMKRGCPASRSGRFVLNTGVSSLVDELMCQFESLKTTHKI